MQGHESAELDADMTGGKVVCLMVGPFTGHEKPLLLVVSRHSWASNLDNVHVISRHQHLPVENEPLLSSVLALFCVVRVKQRREDQPRYSQSNFFGWRTSKLDVTYPCKR